LGVAVVSVDDYGLALGTHKDVMGTFIEELGHVSHHFRPKVSERLYARGAFLLSIPVFSIDPGESIVWVGVSEGLDYLGHLVRATAVNRECVGPEIEGALILVLPTESGADAASGLVCYSEWSDTFFLPKGY